MELSRLSGFFMVVCSVSLIFVGTTRANVKDPDGKITWDELPAEPVYNTSTEEPQLTFDAMFVVASEFIQAVSPHEFSWDLLRDIINGTLDPLQNYTVFVSYSAGFIACFSIGLLFIVAMPIAGFIFCCCRCCENCGGKMLQRDKYNTKCRRISFSLLLTLITGLMILGLAGTFMANSQMSTAVNEIDATIEDNIADVSAFITHTFQEFDFLAFQQFGFVSKLILSDLFNVDQLVGEPVRDTFAMKVDPALEAVLRLGEDSRGLQENLVAVNDSANTLMRKGAQLEEALDLARRNINETLNSISCLTGNSCPKDEVDLTMVTMAADFSIIDVESELNLVNDALQINITDLATQGQKKLNEIPARVKDESKNATQQFEEELMKLENSVQKETSDLEIRIAPMIQEFLEMFSRDSPKSKVQMVYELLDTVETLDKYRFYVGISLCCIILIIVLCNILGVVFGECGRDVRDRPTERGCLSNFGGTLLLAGVAFSFIFSALIMILTTLCFLMGGVSEKVICEPIATKTVFKEVIDYPYLIDKSSQYWLSDNLFGKGSKPITAEGLINDCEGNAGLYSALKLVNIFNITAALDYRQRYPDIETQLDAINIDLSNVDILDSSTEMALTNFIDSGVTDVNYTQYLEEIRKGIVQADLEGLATQLESYATDPLPTASQTRLREHAFTLRDIQRNKVMPMVTYVNSLEANLDILLSKASDLSPLVNQSLIRVQETQDFIRNEGPQLFRVTLEDYVNRILGYVDQYVMYVLRKVKNKVGECKPVADVYRSLEILICKNLVYSFNGFWLCLGWCVLLFIPSIIFAVKLSKFYRRMRFYEDYYNAHDMETVPMKVYGNE